MNSRLRLIFLDLKRSWLTTMIAPVLTGLLIVYVLKRVAPELRSYVFGLRAQQLLVIAFLLWPMLHLKTWFGSKQMESLRAVENGSYTCSWTVVLIYLLEAIVLLPFILFAVILKLNIIKECALLILLIAPLMASLYLLTVITRSVTFAMTIVTVYILFCIIFYNDYVSLRFVMLLKPALENITWKTVMQQVPLSLLSLLGFAVIGKYEKKQETIRFYGF